jgi:hypothetical protein
MKKATKILDQDKGYSVLDLKPGPPTQTTKQWALVNTTEGKGKGKGKGKGNGKGKGKGKAVPLQGWSGPEGSRKLRFPYFMTTAQDGSKVVSLTHRPPLPQEIHLVLIYVRG